MKKINIILMIIGVILLFIAIISLTAKPVLAAILEYYGRITGTITIIGCSCGSWTNQGCGANDCSLSQMYQTRSCTPSGCDTESQCIDDTSCDCSSHAGYNCYNGDVYWYNSCGNMEEKKEECGTSGYTGSNYCYNGDVYRDYVTKSCNAGSCTSSTTKNKQKECVGGCTEERCKVEVCETACNYGKCPEYCVWK